MWYYVPSFIGLAVTVPEIIRRALKSPQLFNGKKVVLNKVNAYTFRGLRPNGVCFGVPLCLHLMIHNVSVLFLCIIILLEESFLGGNSNGSSVSSLIEFFLVSLLIIVLIDGFLSLCEFGP